MKPNRFRKVLAAGGVPIGHMISEFATRGIAKILESADLDFVMVDMEHTAIGEQQVADLAAWLKATTTAPFVRVPQGLYHFLARVMDAGALGVMVANVERPEQAREVVRAVKYAPLGARGVGLGTAHTDYVTPDPAAYFREANENTTVICMIESASGLANLDGITSTEGVDVLWVGHYDLTQSLGIVGQFQSPEFLEALRAVVRAARAHGKAAGIQPGSIEQAGQWLEIGFNVISLGNDISIYGSALRSGISALRQEIAGAATGVSSAEMSAS